MSERTESCVHGMPNHIGCDDCTIGKLVDENQALGAKLAEIEDVEREPLTFMQVKTWWASENGLEDCNMAKLADFLKVVRAVEAAHGIGGKA